MHCSRPAPPLFILFILCLSASLPAQTPVTSLAASAVRSTLATQRALIAAKPKDPRHYIDLAYTLMDVGLGEEAWEQGRLATLADPNSSFAFSAYGWLLHHNAIGIDYGQGYAYDASLAAYRKAIELNPNDLAIRQSLADNLRYDRDGVEHGPTADISHAIEALQYIQARQRPLAPDVANNLAIDLFYAGRFKEALSQAQSYLPTPTLDGVILAALAATQSSDTAIQAASQLTGDTQRRDAALSLAAEALWTLRLYPQAADLLAAAQPDTTVHPTDLRKIQLFRTLKPYTPTVFPSNDPRTPVERLVAGIFSGAATDASLRSLITTHAYANEQERQSDFAQFQSLAGFRQTITAQTGLPPSVVVDIILGRLTLKAELQAGGSVARVSGTFMSAANLQLFLVQEDHSWRLISETRSSRAIGEEALYLLRQNQAEGAGALLDWKRQVSPKSLEDPLGGALIAHLWSVGQRRDPNAIEAAAASLITPSPAAVPLLPDLITFRDKADGASRDFLNLLIASIHLSLGDAKAAQADTHALLSNYPDSITALSLSGRAFALNQDWQSWNAMLATRLAKLPSDPDLLRQRAAEQQAQGLFTEARTTWRTLLDSGRATQADQNMFAWISLFSGQLDEQATEAANQATSSKEPGFAALHTRACLEAAQGKAPEARQTLLQAMAAGHLAQPDDSIWLSFALLYEQYGERDAAIQAFHRVKQPSGPPDPTTAYALAQLHLSQLQTAK